MSWELVIAFEWPDSRSPAAADFPALIREVLDPLHRENVAVTGVRIEQVSEE